MPNSAFRLDVVISAIAQDISAIQKTTEEIKNAQAAADSFFGTLKLGSGIDISRRLIDGLIELKDVFTSFIETGVRFDQTLESTQIGIAAILRQTDRVGNFANFNEAFGTAGQILEQLKKQAIELDVPFQSMASSYQIAASQMSQAGIPIKNQVELIGLLTRAVQVQLGPLADSRQILTETRALLQGTTLPGAQLANAVLATPQDKAAFNQAKEAGTLFEFLQAKLKGTKEASDFTKQSLAGLRQELTNLLQQLGGELALPLFDNLKKGASQLVVALKSPDLADALRPLATGISKFIGDAIETLVAFIPIVEKFASAVGPIIGIFADGLKSSFKVVRDGFAEVSKVFETNDFKNRLGSSLDAIKAFAGTSIDAFNGLLAAGMRFVGDMVNILPELLFDLGALLPILQTAARSFSLFILSVSLVTEAVHNFGFVLGGLPGIVDRIFIKFTGGQQKAKNDADAATAALERQKAKADDLGKSLDKLKTPTIAPAGNTEEEKLKRIANATKTEAQLQEESDRAIFQNEALSFKTRFTAEVDFYKTKLDMVQANLAEQTQIIKVESDKATLEEKQKLQTRLEGLQNAAKVETAKLNNTLVESLKKLTDTENNRNDKIRQAAELRQLEIEHNAAINAGRDKEIGSIQLAIELEKLTNQILQEREITRNRFLSEDDFQDARTKVRAEAAVQIADKERAAQRDYLVGLAQRISIQLAENTGSKEHADLIKLGVDAQNAMHEAELKSVATGGESESLQRRLNDLLRESLEFNNQIANLKLHASEADLLSAQAQTVLTRAQQDLRSTPQQIDQAKHVQLVQEQTDIIRLIELEKERQALLEKNGKKGTEDFVQSQIAVEGLNQRLLTTQHELQVVGSFSGSFRESFNKFYTDLTSNARISSAIISGTIGTALNGISDGINGVIDGTKTWGQAMARTGLDIIHALVKVGVEFLAGVLFRKALMLGETIFHAGQVATQSGVHAAGEGAKTGSTLLGSIARGAIHVGETIWHGIQVAFRTTAHIIGETIMTTVSLFQSGIRIAQTLIEAGKYLIVAAIKGMAAVADIPFVGPILAIAALAAIIAAGAAAIGAFDQGGYTGNGGKHEVAGVVHGGEVVIPKNTVDSLGIGHFASYFPGGMPGYSGGRVSSGYAGGGFVRTDPSSRGNTNVSVTIADVRDRNAERDAVARDSGIILLDRLTRRGNKFKT